MSDPRATKPETEIDPDTSGTQRDFPAPDPKARKRQSHEFDLERGSDESPRDPENPERPAAEPEEWKHSVGPSTGGGPLPEKERDTISKNFRRPG